MSRCDYPDCSRVATTSNIEYHKGLWYCTFHANKAKKLGRIKKKLLKLKNHDNNN